MRELVVHVHEPLRAHVKAATDSGIKNFDLEKFITELSSKNEVILPKLTRFMIYEATADLCFSTQARPDDDTPTTPNQIKALKRFRLVQSSNRTV